MAARQGQMVSYWSSKATGGATAANIVHQASVGALLALELLRDPGLLHPLGEADDNWELHLESLDDLAIVWKSDASVFIQVKNQKLNVALLNEAIEHWRSTAPAGAPTARPCPSWLCGQA